MDDASLPNVLFEEVVREGRGTSASQSPQLKALFLVSTPSGGLTVLRLTVVGRVCRIAS
jgi:hypothetical protein